MTNFNDVFNLQADSFVNKKKDKVGLYKPSADKGIDGVYKAVIRFVPYYKDPNNKSKLTKKYFWCEDPITGDKFGVDCPSSIGKKSVLKDTFWKLYNSESARDKELAKAKFNGSEVFHALIQIVKDPQNPSLEGEILIFPFKVKINEMIEKELKPEFGEDPCNPFDLFEGKNFAIHVVKKNKWNNYDNCKFLDKRGAVVIDGKPLEKTPEDMQRAIKWLEEKSPNLEEFDYKEWTDETEAKVAKYIKNCIPNGPLASQILNGDSKESTSEDKPKAKKASKSSDVGSDLPESNASVKTKTEDKGVSSIDELYNDL